MIDRIAEIEQAIARREAEQQEQAQAASILQQGETQNLVEWQLDFRKELIDIERLLRKQRLVKDKQGNLVYVDPPADEQLLNERGVQAIMELLRWYLNKNIILSNFDDNSIKQRLKQFGNALRRLIFLNYIDFGLDTPYKQKHYEMIVMRLVDIVEAAYYRAFGGQERESLRTARMVHQNQPLNMPQEYPGMGMSQPKKFSIFKPSTWG